MSTGQTIEDRFNAAKYTIAGQALARCICKATTEELMKPKKKHLDYLAASTYESNVSMQQLANLLIERTDHSNWVVVYKALVTVHHLMSHGSDRFIQYLASSNYSFQLNNFLDRVIAKGYAMSPFIRRYSNYINQRALSFRTLAVDLCRNQRKGEDGLLRTMPIERLLETLPVIQKQLDTLLDFSCTADDLNNSIVVASFTLLFHDAIRLFANYNDGIINLIEKYFHLNKKMCREAFESYKKFLASTDRVSEFLKVAEAINLNNGDLPDFKRAPGSLLDAFEQHLTSLETNKSKKAEIRVESENSVSPKFAENPNFDSRPTLGDISREFEAQLTFASDSTKEFEPTFANTPKGPSAMQTKSDDSSEAVEQIAPATKPIQSLDDLNNLFITQPQQPETRLDQPFGQTQNDLNPFGMPSNDILESNPPGFSDGLLLKPEPLQIIIDPSIDPKTQQQLIQIKREQVANSWHNNNNAGGNNVANKSAAAAAAAAAAASKPPTKESMFEDLEKTMRKSLHKAEKT